MQVDVIEKQGLPNEPDGFAVNDIWIHIRFVECIISNAFHKIHSKLFIFYDSVIDGAHQTQRTFWPTCFIIL